MGQPLRILLVDDEPSRHALALDATDSEVTVRHPLDLRAEDLNLVDLVCVDEYLGDEWTAHVRLRSEGLVAMESLDGMSVAAALSGRVRLGVDERDYYAVAMYTADLAKLSGALPEPHREPLTASQHDLEWVFDFRSGTLSLLPRLIEVAAAARSARDVASNAIAIECVRWLQLPDREWADTSRAQVDDCRPPWHELSEDTDGRSYLRWLAQRILPYPTFLLDASYSANLLGITSESFEALCQSKAFQADQPLYTGPMSDAFLGVRWWRAALQQLLVDANTSQWETAAERCAALCANTGVGLQPLSAGQPVVAYDEHGNITTVDAEASESVRIQVDGWPVFADDPWASLSAVRQNERLKRLVAHDDRTRIETE